MGSKTARPAPAGPVLECAIALYRFSLSDCLTGQLKGIIGLNLCQRYSGGNYEHRRFPAVTTTLSRSS